MGHRKTTTTHKPCTRTGTTCHRTAHRQASTTSTSSTQQPRVTLQPARGEPTQREREATEVAAHVLSQCMNVTGQSVDHDRKLQLSSSVHASAGGLPAVCSQPAQATQGTQAPNYCQHGRPSAKSFDSAHVGASCGQCSVGGTEANGRRP